MQMTLSSSTLSTLLLLILLSEQSHSSSHHDNRPSKEGSGGALVDLNLGGIGIRAGGGGGDAGGGGGGFGQVSFPGFTIGDFKFPPLTVGGGGGGNEKGSAGGGSGGAIFDLGGLGIRAGGGGRESRFGGGGFGGGNENASEAPSKSGGGGAVIDLGGLDIRAGGGGGRDSQFGGFGGTNENGPEGQPGKGGGGGAVIDLGGLGSIRAGGSGGRVSSFTGGRGFGGGGGGLSIADFLRNIIRVGGFGDGVKRDVSDSNIGFRREGALIKRQNSPDTTTSTTERSILGGGLDGLLSANSDPSTIFAGLFGLSGSGPGAKTFRAPPRKGDQSEDDALFFYDEKPKPRLASGQYSNPTNARYQIIKEKQVDKRS